MPAASLLRLAMPRQLPQTKEFSLCRTGVVPKDIDMEFIREAAGAFNLRHWRGERPESVQLDNFSWTRNSDGTFNFRFDFVRKSKPKFMFINPRTNKWEEFAAELYPSLDFSEFDFGGTMLNSFRMSPEECADRKAAETLRHQGECKHQFREPSPEEPIMCRLCGCYWEPGMQNHADNGEPVEPAPG